MLSVWMLNQEPVYAMPGSHFRWDSMRWDENESVMRGSLSCWDSTRREENESVRGTFVSSHMFAICSRFVSQLSEKCRLIVPQWKDTHVSHIIEATFNFVS